jgi:CheY-like chemotaxis protein
VAAESEAPTTAESELVLLVEDDDDLRAVTRLLLSDLGYRVVAAASGEEALELLGSIDAVDLLLTDVVLAGGMNGPEVADAARRDDPDLKVAYMSGYLGEALQSRGGVDGSAVLIQKPFDLDDLAKGLRAALEP